MKEVGQHIPTIMPLPYRYGNNAQIASVQANAPIVMDKAIFLMFTALAIALYAQMAGVLYVLDTEAIMNLNTIKLHILNHYYVADIV